ncbi:MAG: hypothetical protein QXU32_06540 [Nitrososphaerales archaeon]
MDLDGSDMPLLKLLITIRYDERLGVFYQRIANRRGPQKARVATAKEMLVIIYMVHANKQRAIQNNEQGDGREKV